jgi:hypothetical protein
MPDQNDSPDTGAQDTPEDPFAGFTSEAFERGEKVDDVAPVRADEATDGGEDDEVPDAGAAETELSGESADSPKPKQSAQERINELTRFRREAERKAEALEAELQQLRQAPRQEEPPAEEEPADEPPKTAEPSPDDFEYGELDPRYIRALASYEAKSQFEALVAEQRQAAARAKAQEEQVKVQQKFQKQIDEGSKKHDDFYEKVVVGAERGAWPLSDDMGKLLVESEVGADIAYHLASHPEEANQVYRQSPLEQARYFGKLEAKFSATQTAAPSVPAGKPAETRTPKAPQPVTPARGSDGRFQPGADTEDFSAFEQRVNSNQ